LIIRAGVWDLNRTSVEGFQMQQRVATIIRSHPEYSSPGHIDNDIAIVRVNQPFKFTKHVQKVCLHNGNQKVATNGCIASAWGAESFETQSELSQYLKKVPMDHVDHDICEKQLRIALKKESFVLADSFFCAGGNEFDLCIGDSGAPLVCPVAGETNKFVLTGLASYGVKCFTETPGIYTNIMKYIDWIRDQTETPSAY
jgi:secreted trypsin-like serine protease